jgi:Cys-rich repeat protein
MNRRGPLLAAGLWLAAALGAGCSTEQRGTACESDGDCAAGQACVAGLCQDVECKLDSDCAAGERCVDHACRADSGCSSDGECPVGEICVEQRCTAGCRADSDCADGLLCVPDMGEHGICADCRSDADCAQAERCVGFECTAACESDADCPDGYCHAQLSVCVECLADEHCPVGQLCRDNACQSGCRQDADCSAGQICDQGQCRQGCRTDADCDGGTCDPDTWRCVGHECSADDECQLGQLCIDHRCVTGCRVDRDCPPPLVCEAAAGAHGICVECRDDQDCPDPDRPRCVDAQCAPECWDDGDCPESMVCIDGHCQQVAEQCRLELQPAQSVDVGLVPVGASLTTPFVLSNRGGQACALTALELEAWLSVATDFSFGAVPALPFALQPGDSVEIEVVFTPSGAGADTALLRMATEDPALQIGSEYPIYCGLDGILPGHVCLPLFGEGGELELQAVPASLGFGRVQLDCRSRETTVSVYNLGDACSVHDIQLETPYDTAFEIVSAPAAPFALEADDSFEVGLRFAPTAAGPQANALLIESDQSGGTPLRVPLSGRGVFGDQVEDHYVLPDQVRVDVLWVIDNSGSMGEEQAALAENFGWFIGFAVELGVDFHIGVVATEVNEVEYEVGDPSRTVWPGVLVHAPEQPAVITPQTVDPEGAFADNVQLGTCCSDEQEAGLQAAWMALSPPRVNDPEANAGFLRQASKLYLIFVSDEEDQSDGPVDFYVDTFRSLRPNPELLVLSAICGDAPDGCEGSMGTGWPGLRYIDAVEQTDGLFQSICQEDWSELMVAIGEHAFAPVRRYPLSRPAAQDTIAVSLDGRMVPEASAPYAPDGWTYEPGPNAVWFGDQVLPGTGSQIDISYTALCL